MSPFRSLTRLAVAPWLSLLLVIGWRAEAIGQQLTATWLDTSSNEAGFSVERAAGTTGTFAEIGTTGPGVTVYTDTTVAPSTTYCYRVRAYNTSAYSGYSNMACGATALAYSLSVVESGTGSGAVISQPSGIICGATCSATYASGTLVTLTATPATGSAFSGWSGGGCSGTGTCTVTVTGASTVTATFVLQSVQSTTLTVSAAGAGTGTVSSSPAGITCGTTCSGSYTTGTAVTLTATAATGSTFAGWSGGGCSGTGACTMTLTAATTVTATFNLPPAALKVRRNGTATGTVTSTPTGIQCGKICSASFPGGTVVTLTATPGTNAMFAGWSGGGCSGTGTCTVTLTAATTVTATFNKLVTLKVSKYGSGVGTVVSVPTGINCGSICSAGYTSGTVVTLTATPSTGSSFAGWSGSGCSGTGSCVVTLSSSGKSVTATFR
jgi:List-Bact-rpt repeat protein